MLAKKLSDIVKLNANFKNAINLYLNLNKDEKVDSYIPTKSSVNILSRYLDSVYLNKSHSTILIGPYGKGKSHLLLVMLAILSMERNKHNNQLVESLVKKIDRIDKDGANLITKVWSERGRFLPVIVMNSQEDLNQAFMIALNDALKREQLEAIMPKTYFSYASETVERWKEEYPETYKEYCLLLQKHNMTEDDMKAGLVQCDASKLKLFKKFYPELTSGSVFNPLAGGDVLPMYKSVADKLREEYGYSGIYIVFDEFSKYIEAQDKHSAGNNMKLLQDICELANESKETQVYLTMVAHKSIKEYGSYLSNATINAFTGIEGRLEEILFITSSKNNYELIQNAISSDEEQLEKVPYHKKYFSQEVVDEYYKIAAFRSSFTISDFEKIIVKGCYPLSPVASYALLNISEKVAQNERTLFTFISKDEPYSMAKYVKEHPSSSVREWIITPDLVYDYFKNIFKKEINNEYIHTEWLNAEYAISKVSEYNKIKMLKTLAVINIINKFDEMPATEEVLILASGVPSGKDTLDSLEQCKLIYKKGSNNCYSFKTRAGSELKNEIKRRRGNKENNINVANVLGRISNMPYILPKRYNYENSMTRYFRFEYLNVEDFLKISDARVFFGEKQFQDGKVLALYNTDDVDRTDAVKNRTIELGCKNLVVVYARKKFDFYRQAVDYDIIQDIKNDVLFMKDNEVLHKEISVMEEELEKEIGLYLEEEFGENASYYTGYFNGKEWVFDYQLPLAKIVDGVCAYYYNSTMRINNELINKQYIHTAPIKKARKIIVDALLNNQNTEMFMNGTSAEATIYRAVMINSGIMETDINEKAESVLLLFDNYFEQCIESKSVFSSLVEKYTNAPYGMRKGVLPILLAYKISKRNEDIVVYYENKEVQMDADTIINMCEFPEEYSLFISKENADKERYIKELFELFAMDITVQKGGNRINSVLVGMQRWYRSLPQTAKNIRNTSAYIQNEGVVRKLPKLKKVLQQVDVNAYEVIFNVLPNICSENSNFAETVDMLKNIKSLLNGYMDWLTNQVISETILVFDRKQKSGLAHALKNWYEKQSQFAKDGLHDSSITGLMSCIAEIKTYDEYEIIQRLVKVVTEIYLDAWNDETLEVYVNRLNEIKNGVESIGDINDSGKCELSFVGKNGETLHKYYDKVDEATGAIFRNILEDTLEDFSDLSVNAKVAILLEAIEKVMKRED